MSSLGNDLAKIRKERSLTIEDIHGSTRIPVHIITSIEDDSIFENPEINPAYIRSYIRSYAKAVSIDEKEIVYALDKRKKGNYAGSLQKFLEEADGKVSEHDEEPKDSSQPKEDIDHDHWPDDAQEKEAQEKPSQPPQPAKKTTDVNSVDWAAMGRKVNTPLKQQPKVWMGLVFLVLIIAIGFVYYFYWGNPSATVTESSTAPESSVTTDSLQLNVLTPNPADNDTSNSPSRPASNTIQSQALNALPDTLTMTVYAAYGKLEPARVYTDIINSTNPYWLEKGEALRFNFVNEFRIRGAISNCVLLMNGHIIKNLLDQFYDPDTQLIKINRSFFKDDPEWLQPAPDSLHIDAPPPSVIKNRPTFNDSM